MTVLRRLPTRAWAPFLAVGVVALVALLVAATRPTATRGFALNAPNQMPVAVLRPSARACEGAFAAAEPVRQVSIWGASVVGRSHVRVDVRDARSRRILASGTVRATTHPSEYAASLDRRVPAGRRVRLCLTSQLNSFSLLGAPAPAPGISTRGLKAGQVFSVVLQDRRSLLSSLPLAFSRASLFKPSWVGSWTFWVLAAALLATLVLGALAIGSADRSGGDPDGGGPDRGDPDGGHPERSPADSSASTTRQ